MTKGLKKGTVPKKELVERLQRPEALGTKRPYKWIDKQSVPELLAACKAFGVDDGITEDMVRDTLMACARLHAKKPGGDVFTIKLYLRTLLGADEDLCQRLDQYAQVWGLIHSRSTVMMELLVRLVLGSVSEDPSYSPPLWTGQLPAEGNTREARRQRHLLDVLCEDPRKQNSFLSQLILPEYEHHAAFERDYLLQELLDDEFVSRLLAPYNREIEARWLAPFVDPRTGKERESSWMNARTYLGVQLQQNLEVHVRGVLLRRVKEYLESVELPAQDVEAGWNVRRDQLFQMVVQGTVEGHAQNMSSELKTCLKLLRSTLQPTSDWTDPLPRRIPFHKALDDLLPLHLFLTLHQRPRAPTPPAPPPSEDEHPENRDHAGLAAALSEKHAFMPPISAASLSPPTPAASAASAASAATSPSPPTPAASASPAALLPSPPPQLPPHLPSPSPPLCAPPTICNVSSGQATVPNTRSFMPLSPTPHRESAIFDQMIVVDMCSNARRDLAWEQAKQEVLPGKPLPHRRNGLSLVKLLPELGADEVTRRRKRAQKDKRSKGKARHRVSGGKIANYLEPHTARTNGVALCINYRPIQHTPIQEAELLLKEHEEAVKDLDKDFWKGEKMGSERDIPGGGREEKSGGSPLGLRARGASSSAGAGSSSAGGATAEGREGEASPEVLRITSNEKGQYLMGWDEGNNLLPNVAAIDPGGAHLGYGAVRSADEKHRQAHDLPTKAWWEQLEGAAPAASPAPASAPPPFQPTASSGASALPGPELSKWQRKRLARKERVVHDIPVQQTVNLSHGEYVGAFRQKKQRRQEQAWQSNPPVRAALDDLSRQGGSRTGGPGFMRYLALQAEHFNVLVEEFVNSPKRAHASMLCYRGKRRAWDRFTSRLLRTTCKGSNPERPVVVGVGASKMPPAAPGVQKFTATTLLKKSLLRAMLRGVGHSKPHPRMLMGLNEYKTTVSCSRCGARTEEPEVKDFVSHQPRKSRRLRECPKCKQHYMEQQQQQQGMAVEGEGEQQHQQQQQQQQQEGMAVEGEGEQLQQQQGLAVQGDGEQQPQQEGMAVEGEGEQEQQQEAAFEEGGDVEQQEEEESVQGSTEWAGMEIEGDEEEEEVGVVEGGMDVEEEVHGENEGEGQVHVAVPGRRRERVKKTQLSYQLHRDVNAAWNLWEVCVAEYFGHPRPGYLRAHAAA